MSAQLVRAAIYSRISHDPEGRALGVERQEQDCRALIAKRGWTAVDPPYRENHTPASTLTRTKRPSYDRMLADVAEGRVGVVVAYSTSRLTRRPSEYERLIELFYKAGLRVVTVMSGAVDLGSADGRAVARILAAMDAAESERSGERIARAALQRAEAGHWHGGRFPPYGYEYQRGPDQIRLVIDPAKASVVRDAAVRVLAGQSLYGLAKEWNRSSRSTTGKPWIPGTIRRMLAGAAVAGYTERDGVLMRGEWEPILDLATWEALRALLLDPSRNTRTFEQATTRRPLHGLVFCSHCGTHLVNNPAGYGPSYVCAAALAGACGRVRIRGLDLERYLLSEVRQRDVAARSGELEHQRVSEVESALADLQEGLHQVQDDHYDGLLSREAFLRQTARIGQQIADVRHQLTPGQRLRLGPSLVSTNDTETGVILRRYIERVLITVHPKGVTTSPGPDWESRRQDMRARTTIVWLSQEEPGSRPVGDSDASDSGTSTSSL